jgi:hypothetical protein
MKALLILSLGLLQAPPAGRITPAGVARAQAVVDSVFLDRTAPAGTVVGGDWAAYMMVRLGVTPLPDSVGIRVAVDSQRILFFGRIQDLPAEARAMLGPLSALVDASTPLTADVILLPSSRGIAHFQLRGVSVGGFPVPDLMLRSMLLEIGERYPALTKTGRDLFVQIPEDGHVALVTGAIRLRADGKQN